MDNLNTSTCIDINCHQFKKVQYFKRNTTLIFALVVVSKGLFFLQYANTCKNVWIVHVL